MYAFQSLTDLALLLGLSVTRLAVAFLMLPMFTQESLPPVVRNSLFVALAIMTLTVLPQGEALTLDDSRDELRTAWRQLAEVEATVDTRIALLRADLRAAARAKPGTLGYGTGGVGSGQHLVAELLSAMAGVRLLHVPYKGGMAPVSDLVGGQIPMVVEIESVLVPQVRAGKVRVLATTGPARTPLLPEVPTVAESGVRDFVVQGWLGVLGPRGIAPARLVRLNAVVREAVADPATVAAIEKGGAVARAGSAEAFAALVQADTQRWARVVRDANIQVQ